MIQQVFDETGSSKVDETDIIDVSVNVASTNH